MTKGVLYTMRILLVLLALPSNIFAQSTGPQLVKLTPPSPNVMAMQKYGDIPISAYTGVPSISIPLYNIKFRDISVPISISYHASGIKVAEEAGIVGLGWTLNAGGNISRNIIGDDDFNGSKYFNDFANNIMDIAGGKGPTNFIPTGCVLPMYDNSVGSTQTFFNLNVTSYLANGDPFDFQPDQYYYNFLNKNGKFVLTRQKKAIIQKQDPVTINVTASNGSAWQVKSEDGYTYDFAVSETYQDNLPPFGHFSAWYLTKITSPAGNTITFNYIPNNHLVTSVGSYSESRDDFDLGVGGHPSESLGSSSGYTPGKNYKGQLLSSIDFTNGRVEFSYSDSRIDLPGENRLDNISIFTIGESTPLKKFSFIYDYFTGQSDPSYNNIGTTPPSNVTKRLKLTQILETGFYGAQTIQNPPYVFSYSESNDNPAKTSFARDHWGYFNGVTGRTSLIPSVIPINSTSLIASALGLVGLERESNPYYATAFNIKSIKYPTGGWTEFEFESNDFDEAASQKNDFSYFNQQQNTAVQKTQSVSFNPSANSYSGSNIIDLTNQYVFPASQGGGYPMVSLSASFRFEGGTGGYCNDVFQGGGNGPGLIYFELKNASGNLISRIDPYLMPICSGTPTSNCIICQPNSPVFSYTSSFHLSPGIYTWTAYAGNTGAALKLKDIRATYSWYEQLGASATNSITVGGGLRIKRIIDHDGINESNNKIKRYDYHYRDDKNGTGTEYKYSYGRRMSKPQYAYFKISADDYQIQTPSGCNSNFYKSFHLIRTSDSNIPLNGSASGSVVGYDQVTELLGENGEYGKSVYKYINEPDRVSGYNEPFTTYDLPQRPPYGSSVANALNGSLLNETVYANIKGVFVKVKEINNQYSAVANKRNVVYGLEEHVMPALPLGSKCRELITTPCDNNSTVFWYQTLQSEWNLLTSKSEKIYNDKGDTQRFEEIVTNYFYDNSNHQQLTRTVTTNSKGQQITSNTKYPLDYTIVSGANDAFTQGVQNLRNKHIINAPIETYIQKKNADGTEIGATSYVLTSYKNTLPSPSIAYMSRLAAPNPVFVPSSISGTGLVKDNSYEPLIYFDNYDAFGNILQQHKVNDINHTYIWDYNNSQVIAEVTNAASNEIAYTSFEADGSGNWNIPATARNSGNALTGSQYYTLASGSITANVASGKQYIVSYWSKNGALTVNGISAVQGNTKNGWTYFEHILPTTTSTVSVSSNGAEIDELRLYPKNALMMTYTYYPLIGITSGCDSKNYTSYYVYDGLGRLQYVKDADGNILKTYEYHLQGQ
jgi:hypothetical protein